MAAHVITIETKPIDPACTALGMVNRWRCSCGRVGEWRGLTIGARQARNGGARHAAAKERGR